MSADPSLQRPDVDSDGPAADGASDQNGSTPKNNPHQQPGGSGQSSRSRRNRRGRRRRGRRSGRGNGPQAGSENTAGEATASGDTTDTVSAGAAKKPRSGKPGPAKPPHGKTPQNKNNHHRNSQAKGKNPQATTATETPQATKPSDLAGRAASASTSASSPASMPRTRRRAARRPDTETPPRLHTVRETSAGGLVLSDIDAPFNELSAALIGRIDRRGRMMWSLPKGHIETGETAEQTAMREVEEETGIEGTIVAPLGKIDYWFVSEGKRIHKTVHHYLLRFTGGELSDADYEVSAVAWVPLGELPRRLTYSDERRLARMAESVIADLQSDPHRLAQSEASCLRTEPNDYEKAAAARNQRRNEPPPAPKPRRRRRRPRRTAAGDS
ncbi:NUDIX hydrolase [Gordonia hydrophobica]|uniref:NUDIX hydrolase n=1 Tax=Gordonia hydrophobica TaxID=40516 RepID=A0ABZ2U5E5_9ACTN|nr:NUDIX hydrolase [Gordonia hydrophobica]MBM7368741.1 ADP-ribose pyrophosphatase YjhB (NUDIX family) [Gordonia hydrophobica]